MDLERADIAREAAFMRDAPEAEEAELASIWESRGLSPATAKLVAHELSQTDALAAHVLDELGLSEVHSANPLQAAFASVLTFTVAGAIPMLAAVLAPEDKIALVVVVATLIALALLGAIGARARCKNAATHHTGRFLGRGCYGGYGGNRSDFWYRAIGLPQVWPFCSSLSGCAVVVSDGAMLGSASGWAHLPQ